MDEATEQLTKKVGVEIPDSLHKVEKVPQGFVPVYFYETKTDLQRLGAFGFQPELNGMDELKPDIENIFDEERVKAEITVDRGECLFAFPKHPDKLAGEFPFEKDTQVMVEAYVDPRRCIVAEGEFYTEAAVDLDDGNADSARDWAASYWKEAMTLDQYLQDRDAQENFQMIEVLVPGPISTDLMRVVSNPKGLNPRNY